ncbi:FliH/SctL family protein, partial [Micrococcus sp. SIMBA_144]
TAIAKKIIMNELEQRPEVLLGIVQDTLKKVQDRGEVVFQVSTEDYQHVMPMVDELEKQLDVNASLKLVPMNDLEVGSGLVHTPSGSYDISI